MLFIAAMLISTAGTVASDGDSNQAGELARKTLAAELGVVAETVRVASVEAVEWPDSNLGCPTKGTMSRPVVTPGHRVILEAAGRTWMSRSFCTMRPGSQRKGQCAPNPSRYSLVASRSSVEMVTILAYPTFSGLESHELHPLLAILRAVAAARQPENHR